MNASAPRVHIEAVGAGPPLLLLHGWGMHGGLFAPILPALAQGHRVHVADLPGHGHSAPLSPLTADGIVAALDAALAQDDAPLTIVGWSLGGALALHWALRRPQRVGKLVLVCTTPAFVARADWPHAMARDTLRMFGDELRVAYRQTLQRFLTLQVQGSEAGRATLARLRHELFARGEPAPGVLAESLALLEGIDLRSVIPQIRTRTLVLTGARDALAPPEAGAWLARTLPDARLVEIAGAAHAPFLSHRDAFGAAVAEFLDAR